MELSLANDGHRARPQVPYLDRPWTSMRIHKTEWWQLNLRRRILELHQIAGELAWDDVLLGMQTNDGFVLQRVVLAGEKSKVDKKCLHRKSSLS
jgi:hypothetical protein